MVIDAALTAAFPKAVNDALRGLLEVATNATKRASRAKRTSRKSAAT